MAPLVVAGGLVALVVVLAGCGGAGDRIEAVDTLPQAPSQSIGVGQTTSDGESGSSELTRRGGEEPGAILEYGLFGPVLPASEGEIYETDCRFEDDPYETCL